MVKQTLDNLWHGKGHENGQDHAKAGFSSGCCSRHRLLAGAQGAIHRAWVTETTFGCRQAGRQTAEGELVSESDLLFFVAKLTGVEVSCGCGAPAELMICGWTTTPKDNYCGQCAAAYVLQYMKNLGVNVDRVCEQFPAASKVLEAPPAPTFVQWQLDLTWLVEVRVAVRKLARFLTCSAPPKQ